MGKRKNMATNEITGGAIVHNYGQPSRNQDFKSDLNKRLNRAIGRINGVKKMVDSDRYCSDIIMQIAAAQSILRQCEFLLLSDHMKNCAVPEMIAGRDGVLDEFEILIKTLR